MSLPLVLILLVFGIALSQAISSSGAVTLRWLRLGDLIGLSLLGLAAAILLADAPELGAAALRLLCVVLAIGAVVHLVVVQLGRRSLQRAAIGATCILVTLVLVVPPFAPSLEWLRLTAPESITGPRWAALLLGPALVLAAWLTGGSLMSMLLGHAYLTSGAEMTQQPFLRLVRLLLAGLVVRLAVTLAGGLAPWWTARASGAGDSPATMTVLLITARLLMGFLVPLVMTWMTLECVRIRSNQSATGILYVSSTMILVGEILGLTLLFEFGLPF